MSETAKVKFTQNSNLDGERLSKAITSAFEAQRLRDAVNKFGPMIETLAGVFCMAYRRASEETRIVGGEPSLTHAEIAAQSAVEAFLETLTR